MTTKQQVRLEEYQNVLSWNVIEKGPFRERTRNVFSKVAQSLTNTLGPNGATTILEQYGEMHITKDGWSVLKRISFNDPVENSILNLLTQISAQVVNKVGDGSTSSIIAANEILKEIENNSQLKSLRPKDTVDKLKELSDTIRKGILDNSLTIDREGDFNEIYQLTKISTNGDEDVARTIQSIYKETQNPSIEIRDSKTAVTHSEIITGYQSNITMVDPIYATHEDGSCRVEQPLFLIFDHTVDMDSYDEFIGPAMQYGVKSDQRVVIVAPHYDRNFLQIIGSQATKSINAGSLPIGVFTIGSLFNNAAINEINDLATLLGAKIVREYDSRERYNLRLEHREALKENPETPNVPAVNIEEYLGRAHKTTLSEKTTLTEGFFNKNESMYEVALKHAASQLNEAIEASKELNIVDVNVYELKKRLAKLQCKMGVIFVGGRSRLERRANTDLVEDAVKAAESAYQYGYTLGGNLSIPIAINDLLNDNSLDIVTAELLKSISAAFQNVFKAVLRNKYDRGADDEQIISTIVDSCVSNKQCYDLINEEYSHKIINPTFTDVEILSAATSIVALVVSSNQFISIATDQDVPS